jgi:hypothetical protein
LREPGPWRLSHHIEVRKSTSGAAACSVTERWRCGRLPRRASMMSIQSRGSAHIRHNIAQERQGQDVRDGCISGAQPDRLRTPPCRPCIKGRLLGRFSFLTLRSYGHAVTRRRAAMGIRDRPTAPRSPWQNGHTERLIGSIRRVPGPCRGPWRSPSSTDPSRLCRLLQSRPNPSCSEKGHPSRPPGADDRINHDHPFPRRAPSSICTDGLDGRDSWSTSTPHRRGPCTSQATMLQPAQSSRHQTVPV